MSKPPSSIARACSRISSSGSIVSCITPIRNGWAIAPILRPARAGSGRSTGGAAAEQRRGSSSCRRSGGGRPARRVRVVGLDRLDDRPVQPRGAGVRARAAGVGEERAEDGGDELAMCSSSSLPEASSRSVWKRRSGSIKASVSSPTPPHLRDRLLERFDLRVGRPLRGQAGGVGLDHPPQLDACSRKRASGPASSCQASTSGSRRFHSRRGRTRVPVFGRDSTRRFAASTLTASRRPCGSRSALGAQLLFGRKRVARLEIAAQDAHPDRRGRPRRGARAGGTSAL